MVIVTSAVMPARTSAGAFESETMTAYDTTPPVVLPTAVGAIAVTLPSTVASTAAIETVARLPDGHRREVALDDVGRDLERLGVDDDRVTRRGVEPGDDVDGRHDAVDRGGQGRELDLGLAGRHASCVALETCVSAL